MKKRVIAWIVLLAVFLAAVPAAYAAGVTPVEDFTVERDDSGITVTLPAGYSAKGFFKLFWKNEVNGEIRSDVFPADTPSYRIETEEGAEYSFQLYYAKRRGSLPASWKEEQPPADAGPCVWKVLWIDAAAVDFRGITNHMSGADCLASEETARGFESLAEELTGGLVDLEITRMTLDVSVTELGYEPERGYIVSPDNIDMKHYALRRYDSVFVFARMDHILLRYSGITIRTENPKEYPGYSFMPLAGEDNALLGGYDILKDICVHEWIHQLGYLYDTYHLEIPNPDTPEKYGYSAGSGLDHGLFRDILSMNAVSEDGRYIGVPAEAWQYRPTNHTFINLSSLQEKKAPSSPAPREEESPPPAERDFPEADPAVFGAWDDDLGTYTNTVMGLSCSFSDWYIYDLDDLPYPTSSAELEEDDPDFVRNNDSIMTMFSASANEPCDISLSVCTAAVPFVRENGESAFLLEMKKLSERWAAQNNCEEPACDLVERSIAGRTLPGVRFSYVSGGIKVYLEMVVWLNGDYLNSITVDCFMFDNCQELLDCFTWLDS